MISCTCCLMGGSIVGEGVSFTHFITLCSFTRCYCDLRCTKTLNCIFLYSLPVRQNDQCPWINPQLLRVIGFLYRPSSFINNCFIVRLGLLKPTVQCKIAFSLVAETLYIFSTFQHRTFQGRLAAPRYFC